MPKLQSQDLRSHRWTSAAEAMGLTLPGAASIPAPDSRHSQMAVMTGRRIVEAVWEDLRPKQLLTVHAFDNVVTAVLALGGSTNVLVHLVAMARRAGVTLTLDRFDELARRTSLVANVRPAGAYLMEDFYYEGCDFTVLTGTQPTGETDIY
jgi:dihydroxy-acid dehydratase